MTVSPLQIEQAMLAELADEVGPHKYLFATIFPATGGARTHHMWTNGGRQLGDTIDDIALAKGYDGCDFLEYLTRHGQTVERGRHHVQVVDLVALHADLQSGVPGAVGQRRHTWKYLLSGQWLNDPSADMRDVGWSGFGPRLLMSTTGTAPGEQ